MASAGLCGPAKPLSWRQEEMREDALRLLVLLGCYQRHEVRNGFRSLLEELMAEDKALPSLLQAANELTN